MDEKLGHVSYISANGGIWRGVWEEQNGVARLKLRFMGGQQPQEPASQLQKSTSQGVSTARGGGAAKR